MKSTVKQIFFDLDHTLWDFDRNSTITLTELFYKYGLHNSIESAQHFVQEYQKINEYYWSLYRVDKVTKDELRTIRFEKTFAHFGIKDWNRTVKFSEEYINNCPHQTNLLPGCIEILEYLAPNYPMHIITNGFEEVQKVKMEGSGIAKYFEHVVNSEAVAKRKPNPIIFNHASGLTQSSGKENLMVGDHFEADVLGARAVGWHAIFFDPHNNGDKDDPFRISALLDLKQLL